MKSLTLLNPIKGNILLALSALLIGFSACKHDPPKPATTGPTPEQTQYPIDVARIFINKCATSGCHNEASYKGAGSLRMDDFEYLFNGSSNGSVVVPYSPENSSIMYFINPSPNEYDNISVEPTMPYNQPPLSKQEYDIIKDWIAKGAPDKNGNIPFGTNPDARQKAYLTQQGCDLLGVIDAEKNVIIRYIKIGKVNNIEAPHFVKVDNQGRYAYTCFVGGKYIQKIDTRTDEVVDEIDLSAYNTGFGINVVNVSPDGKKLIATQLLGNGYVLLINTDDMTVESTLAILNNPHGIAGNPTYDTFYLTGQYGNTIYKLTIDKQVTKLSLDENPPVSISYNGSRDPHEIMMTPDYSKYFVTCENSHEVRVMDRLGDTLIKAIPVGKVPKELAVSKVKPYMFVTCMEDPSKTSSLFRGSVYVINYNTLEVVKRIDGSFFQPHGITVDDRNGKFFVASRNASTDGPAPHHVADCGGRNGYYQVYDLNTLEPATNIRYEVTPDPYSFDIRFK